MASLNKAGNIFKNAKIIWAGIAILLIFVFIGTLQLLKSVYQTETYYVLNQDVPVRAQISMDMLTPVVTSYGTAPGGSPDMKTTQKESERSAILSTVQSGQAFAQYPLVSGDVLSPSNVGALSDISVGVPDTWVISSIQVDFNNAVQGRIKRGSYFDMMVVAADGTYYPFVNVLALETLDGGANNSAASTNTSGTNAQTSIYTVGMSPQNTAKLQWLMSFADGQIKLVLSPRQNEYASPRIIDYQGQFFYNVLRDGVIAPGLQPVLDANGKPVDLDGDGIPDQREITDYTFSNIARDQFGRPIKQVENVGLGNAKVPASAANGKSPTNVNAEDTKKAAECKTSGGVWTNGACDTTGSTSNVTPDGSSTTKPGDTTTNKSTDGNTTEKDTQSTDGTTDSSKGTTTP